MHVRPSVPTSRSSRIMQRAATFTATWLVLPLASQRSCRSRGSPASPTPPAEAAPEKIHTSTTECQSQMPRKQQGLLDVRIPVAGSGGSAAPSRAAKAWLGARMPKPEMVMQPNGSGGDKRNRMKVARRQGTKAWTATTQRRWRSGDPAAVAQHAKMEEALFSPRWKFWERSASDGKYIFTDVTRLDSRGPQQIS